MSKAPAPRRLLVLHDAAGRILALAAADAAPPGDGPQTGWRPVPGPGQVACAVELAPEQADWSLAELIEAFELHRDAEKGRPYLRRRSAGL
jgi:hypothetical protein